MPSISRIPLGSGPTTSTEETRLNVGSRLGTAGTHSIDRFSAADGIKVRMLVFVITEGGLCSISYALAFLEIGEVVDMTLHNVILLLHVIER